MNGPDNRARLEVSIVAPLFNEEANVDRFVTELLAVLRPLVSGFEIVLVDDGSSDRTWERIAALERWLPSVRGISLLRNFGHQRALLAGLAHASGRAVITMDGDLQHPPSLIPRLLEAWRNGAKVVHTSRLDADDTGLLKRLTSRGFYWVFSKLAGFDVPPGTSDFRLVDAAVLETLLRLRDPEPFLRGMIHWLGAPSATIAYRARPRNAGRSKFTLGRMIRLSVRGLVSFTTLPLRLGTWAAAATGVLCFAEIGYIVVQYTRGETVPGWASVLTVVSFMFGILFLLLGILGTYLASVHEAVRNRPLYVVGRETGAAAHAAWHLEAG